MSRYHEKSEPDPLGEIVKFRISDREKEDLRRAASLSGLQYTTYAKQRLVQDIQRDLEAIEQSRFILNESEWNSFIEILDSPIGVTSKLKEAKEKFKKKYLG